LDVTSYIAHTASVLIKNNPSFFGKHAEHGILDAFIAATAIEHRLTLVTLNRKHFEKLKRPDLNCIIIRETEKNWHL